LGTITALLVACGALLVWFARPAAAHAALDTTIPADGETVADAPSEVLITFNEPVEATLGAARVYDGTGTQVDEGDARLLGDDHLTLRVGLPSDLDQGTFVVTWSATSEDAHPVKGAFLFNVGQAGTPDQSVVQAIFADANQEDVGLGAAASAVRVLVYLGVLLAVGGVVFLLWVHDRADAERRPLIRMVLAGAGVAAGATVVGIAVQGALLTGLGLRALTDPQIWGEVVGTSYGLSASARLAGLAGILVFVPRLWHRAPILASAASSALVLVSFTLTGHPASTQPRWLVVGADLSHTLAAATWFGGLALLLVALRRRRAQDDAVGGGRLVARFSTLATGAVVLVSVAGLGLAWIQVRAVRALVSSTYGWTLLAKIAVVGLVLAVASYNNRRLVPAIRSGTGEAWGTLRRTVRLEVVGLVLVLAVTGVLVNLVPARTAAGVEGAVSAYADLGEEYQVNLTVDPSRAGDNQFHLYLLGDDGRPVDVAEQLTMEFALPAEDIGPLEREPFVAGPGHWTLSGPILSIPGQWQVTVRTRIGDFEELAATIPVRVSG
jgi:copper transport protein